MNATIEYEMKVRKAALWWVNHAFDSHAGTCCSLSRFLATINIGSF